jgi:hypothetical protein
VSKLGLGRHVLKKARMRPEKEGRKKQLLAPIARESRMIRSSTKRKNDRFERAKR